MLGFDAFGRRSLGQLPSSPSVTLTALNGAFAETGIAAAFKLNQISAVGTFAETGIAAVFRINEPAITGTFAETGIAAVFALKEATVTVTYAVTGISAGGGQNRLSALTGVISISAPFVGLEINFPVLATSYSLTGNSVSFPRGFESWAPEPFDTDTWTPSDMPSNVWTPVTPPTSTWTKE